MPSWSAVPSWRWSASPMRSWSRRCHRPAASTTMCCGLGSRSAFVCSWSLVLGYISVVAFEAVALPQTVLFLAPDMLGGQALDGR